MVVTLTDDLQRDAALSLEDAYAELARMGFMPISGGSGEGDGGDSEGDDSGTGEDESSEPAKAKAKELLADLAKERKSRQAAEKTLKDLQKQIDDLNAKDQSELERTKTALTQAQKDLEEKNAKLREKAARSALIDEATKANALRPDAVYKLVKDDAEYDDDGEITNAAALIQEARKTAPELFGTKQGGQGNGGAQDAEGGEDTSSFGVSRLRSAYAASSKSKKR
jgi:hypothetical protein